jgi:hypothetical protein
MDRTRHTSVNPCINTNIISKCLSVADALDRLAAACVGYAKMTIVEMQGKVLLLRVNGVQRASLKCQNDDTYSGRR